MILPKIQINDYNEIFFDLDGVLLDTNSVKKQNISAAIAHKDPEFIREFVDYFVGNNGVPREIKVARYFEENEANLVLEQYALLNEETLHKAAKVHGIEEFLASIAQLKKPIHVFTGGTEEESRRLLELVGLLPFFEQVHGGPRTKAENFARTTHQSPILMFGDSRSDHEFALANGFDFVFVSGFTQFGKWVDYFKEHRIAAIIEDFRGFASHKPIN